jgi:hypothetical protein
MSRFDTNAPLTSDRAVSEQTAQEQASKLKHNPDVLEQTVQGSIQQSKNYLNKANEVTMAGVSSIFDTLEHASQKLSDLTGLEKGSLFKNLSKWSADWANYYTKKITYPEYMDNALNHFMTNVVGGVAGSGPGLLEFMGGPEWAAIRGWANAAPGNEVQDSIYGALERYGAGKIIGKDGIAGLGSVGLKGGMTRGALGGAYGVTHAAVQGETDPTKLAESGAIMGIMSSTMHEPQKQVRDFTPTERVKVTSPNYQRLHEAYKQGITDEATLRIGQRLLELDPQMDVNTAIRVSDEIKFAAGEVAENFSGLVDIVTGSEQTILKDGLLDTAIELYQGHDAFTLLHEVGHRAYERMSPEQQALVQDAFKKAGNGESVKEWFADFTAENLLADLSWLRDQQTQNTLTKVKDSFIGLIGQIAEVPGAQIDPAIRTIFERVTGQRLAVAPPVESATLGAPGASIPQVPQLREPNNQVKQMPFYSAGRRALEDMDFETRANGSKTDGTLTGPELLKKLEKTSGLKKEEFEDNGIYDFLRSANRELTREEILELWDAVTPEVEVVDTRSANKVYVDEIEEDGSGYRIRYKADDNSFTDSVLGDTFDLPIHENIPETILHDSKGFYLLDAAGKKQEYSNQRFESPEDAAAFADEWIQSNQATHGIEPKESVKMTGELGYPKFPMYTEAGDWEGLNKDYAEYVLKLKGGMSDNRFLSRADNHMDHFKNQVGHMRVTVRDFTGVEKDLSDPIQKTFGVNDLDGRYLVIEELQSDQRGKYSRYPDKLSDIPILKKSWEMRLIKEALNLAVEKNLDGIVLPSAEVQDMLYGSPGIYWDRSPEGDLRFYVEKQMDFNTETLDYMPYELYRGTFLDGALQDVVRRDKEANPENLFARLEEIGIPEARARLIAKQAIKRAQQSETGEYFPRHEGQVAAYGERIPNQVRKYLRQIDPELKIEKVEDPNGQGITSRMAVRFSEKAKQKIREGQPNYQVKSVKMHKGFIENPEADYLNLQYIRSTNGANAAIMRLKEKSDYEIPDAERTEITKAQKQGLADDLGINLGELNSGHQMTEKTAEDIIAYRQLLARSGDDLLKLAITAQAEPTSKNLASFLEQLRLHNGVRSFVSGKMKHAQRHFRSAGGLAEKGNEAEAAEMRSSLLATAGGEPGVTKRLTKFFATLADEDGQTDLAHINRLSREVQRATTWDVVMEAWINGLLSSFKTHGANIISNTAFLTHLVAERSAETAYSRTLGSGDMSLTEPLYMMYGMTTGLKDAFKLAYKALQKGQSSGQVSKVEAPFRAISSERLGVREDTPWGKAIDMIGEVVRGPGRMLVTEDEFFKAIAVRAQKHALAARMVHQKKINPLSEEGRRMMEEVMNTKADDLGIKAREFGHYATFTNDMGDFGKGVHKVLQQAPVMKVVVPFMRTTTNIAKIPIVRSPFAPVLKEVREDFAAGGARRDSAVSRMALGSAVSALVAQLVLEGVITGDGPPDTSEKARMRSAGWKPNSIKIGNEYIAYERIEPFNRFFTPVANIVEAWSHLEQVPEEEQTLVPAYLAAVYGKALADPTYLANLTKLFAAIDRPMSRAAAGQFALNLAGSTVPAIVADVNRTWFDEQMRVCENYTDRIKSRIPGLSNDLPSRQDHWGEDVSYAETLGPAFLSPIFTSKESTDPVKLMMDQNEINLGMPSHYINHLGESIRLTPDQYYEYVKTARQPAKRKIDKMYRQGVFSQLSRDGKEKVVKRVVRAYQTQARNKLVKKYGQDFTRKARSMR